MIHNTQSGQISQKQDERNIFATMALWQLMHFGTNWHFAGTNEPKSDEQAKQGVHLCNCTSLPQSHCKLSGDNGEDTLFS